MVIAGEIIRNWAEDEIRDSNGQNIQAALVLQIKGLEELDDIQEICLKYKSIIYDQLDSVKIQETKELFEELTL